MSQPAGRLAFKKAKQEKRCKPVCSELQNVKGSLWFADILQKQPKASKILLHDKQHSLIEVANQEKDESEDFTVLQKKKNQFCYLHIQLHVFIPNSTG